MALEKEMATYQREASNLRSQEGKFALIIGESVIDVFDTYEDALKQGYRTAGLYPFLVKQLQTIEQVQFISRDIAVPCLTR